MRRQTCPVLPVAVKHLGPSDTTIINEPSPDEYLNVSPAPSDVVEGFVIAGQPEGLRDNPLKQLPVMTVLLEPLREPVAKHGVLYFKKT
jgi:hypothetical protein